MRSLPTSSLYALLPVPSASSTGGKKIGEFLLPQSIVGMQDVLLVGLNARRQLVDLVSKGGATLVEIPSKLAFPLVRTPHQPMPFATQELGIPYKLFAGHVRLGQLPSLEGC